MERYIDTYMHKYASCLDAVARLFMLEYRLQTSLLCPCTGFHTGFFPGRGNVDACKGCMCVSVHPLGFCRF